VTGEALKSHGFTRRDREIERKKTVLEAKIASLQEEFESVKDELYRTQQEEQLRQEILEKNRRELVKKRYINENASKTGKERGNGKSK
jgi:circadian clock protein KaiC